MTPFFLLDLPFNPKFIIYVCIFCSWLIVSIQSSPGDRSPIYRHCVEQCIQTKVGCPTSTDFFLHLLQWTCKSNCRYLCMWKPSQPSPPSSSVSFLPFPSLEPLEQPVQQYFGKWPFRRLFGMQELVSVLMSVLNGYQHYQGYQRLVRTNLHIPSWVTLMYYASINLWIWSTLFHARDTWFTERMDYLSASLGNLTQFIGGLVHVYHWSFRTCFLFMLFILVVHVYRLFPLDLNYQLDYGYNMKFNLGVALLIGVVWLKYGFQSYLQSPPSSSWNARFSKLPFFSSLFSSSSSSSSSSFTSKLASKYLIFTLLGMGLALSLEIIDVPPLFWLVDSHALWHTCTVPLVYTWYQFVYHDLIHSQFNEKDSLLPNFYQKLE